MDISMYFTEEELEGLKEFSVRVPGHDNQREAKMTPEEREAENRKRQAKEVSDVVAAKRARKEKKKREARKRLGNPFLNPDYFSELGQPIFQEDYSDEEDDEMEEDSDDVEILGVVNKKTQFTDEQKILEEPEPVYYTLKKRPRKVSDEAEIQEILHSDSKKKKMSEDEMTQKNMAEYANPVQKTAPKQCRDIADELIQKIKAETAVKVEKPQQKPEQVPGKKLSRYQRLSPEERKAYNKRKTDAKRLRRQQMKREAMAAEEQLNDAPVNSNAYYQDQNDENQVPVKEEDLYEEYFY